MLARVIPLTFLFLLTPSAQSADFLLFRDAGSLHLLSPSLHHRHSLAHTRSWEGSMSCVSVDQNADTLVLSIHADLAATPWWLDFRLTQYPDGRCLVTWGSTQDCDRVTFARFQSFDEAWADNRVRRTLAPYLAVMGLTLPARQQLDQALGSPKPPADPQAVADLESPDPRVRHAARGKLAGCEVGYMRKRQISPEARNEVGVVESSRVTADEVILWWGEVWED